MAVYSYKMSRTRVYPVGIVRKPATRSVEAAEVIPDFIIANAVAAALDGISQQPSYTGNTLYDKEREHIIRILRQKRVAMSGSLGSTAQLALKRTIASHSAHRRPDLWLWCCPKCNTVQSPEKDLHCIKCAYTPRSDTAKETGNPPERGVEETRMSPLYTQVAQHGRTLHDFEERIRKLEKTSVVQRIYELQDKKVESSDRPN